MINFKQSDKGVIIAFKVIPKSKSSEIVGFENDELKVKLAAVPEKGEANDELIRFLSKKLKIGKSNIKLVSGDTSRHKKVLVEGIEIEQIKEKLSI